MWQCAGAGNDRGVFLERLALRDTPATSTTSADRQPLKASIHHQVPPGATWAPPAAFSWWNYSWADPRTRHDAGRMSPPRPGPDAGRVVALGSSPSSADCTHEYQAPAGQCRRRLAAQNWHDDYLEHTHNILRTISSAIARVGRPNRLYPKASVRQSDFHSRKENDFLE